jgi:hypothetical protein
MAFAMILPGIYVKKEFGVKVAKLNKAALHTSMGALIVLVALLLLCTIQGLSSIL